MVAGTGAGLPATAESLAKPEVTGLQITHTKQKSKGGEGRATLKMNQGLRMCSVNITSIFKKAIWWLPRVPYDIVFVQEHHRRLGRNL
eukprot:3744359-Karenia_brevis.AAC.1